MQKVLSQEKYTVRKVVTPEVNKQVLRFIKNFNTYMVDTEKEYEVIRRIFRTGYCWHFAHLLKTTFGRGEVCWAAPFGHFIWLDNEIPYDIEGVYYGESLYFIPESYLGDTLRDFLHIPDIAHNTTAEEIMGIIHRYEKDNNLPNRDDEVLHLLQP